MDISAHLTPDELALLAEGKAGDAAERFRGHLAHCQSCYQAYHDAVEFRARALAGQEPTAPPELVKNGRKIPLGRSERGGVTRKSSLRTILVTVAAVVALGATWIFFGPGKVDETSSSPPYVAKIRDLASQGWFISEVNGMESSLYRDGAVRPSRDVQAIIDSLQTLSSVEKASPDDLFWLTSINLAVGDLSMARTHLEKAGDSSNPRFLKLKAILAYRENDLTDAEQKLREVLQKKPGDHEAELNLGILLAEQGRTTDALKLLKHAHKSKDPQITQRAEPLLDSLSGSKAP